MTDSHTSRMNHLQDVVDEFSTAMLITHAADGRLQARPMSIAEHDEQRGTLVFSTSINTEKTDEVEADGDVCVSMQSASRYVSLSGRASISNDRERIASLFNTAWKLWFPDGPEQPDIRLIEFTPTHGEYWDMSGARAVSFLWEAGKAMASGEAVATDKDDDTHGEIHLGSR